jgi:GAF domain-containing protein
VGRTIFEQGLVLLGASAGALLLIDPDAPDQLEIQDQFGYPEPLIEAWRRFPMTIEAPVPEAVRLGVPVWVESRAEALARYPVWAAAVVAGRDHAWTGLPLEVGGRVLGALGLTWFEERVFEVEEQRFLVSVARLCAQALDRAEALDEARRRAAELEAVLEAAPVPRRSSASSTPTSSGRRRRRAWWPSSAASSRRAWSSGTSSGSTGPAGGSTWSSSSSPSATRPARSSAWGPPRSTSRR